MNFLQNIPLKHHSTFNVGGPASYFVTVRTLSDLKDAVRKARAMDLPILTAGEFSNMLISDHGFPGVVIKNGIKGYEVYEKDGSVFVSVGAGENWDTFVRTMIQKELSGVENLSGIPGSVGATPIQNVGAYGTEVADLISWVEVLDTQTMETEVFSNRQCQFGYRDSFFKTPDGKRFIVIAVAFKLNKQGTPNISYKDLKAHFNETGERPTLQSVRKAVLKVRRGKFPDLRVVGCGGSFFKNPIVTQTDLAHLLNRYGNVPHYKMDDAQYKVPLAWMLEHAIPWKGVRRKNVGVHDKQPLVLVHYGGGTAQEMKQLADDITHQVSREANILITPEVRLIGTF